MCNIILSRTLISRIEIMMGVGTLNIAVVPAVFRGLIISALSWRYILAFMLPLLAAAIAGLYAIDSCGPQEKRPFDMRSFFWIFFSFTGFVYGIAEFGKNGMGIIEQFLLFGLCVGGDICLSKRRFLLLLH